MEEEINDGKHFSVNTYFNSTFKAFFPLTAVKPFVKNN